MFFAYRGWVVIGNPRQPYATGSVHTGFPVYLFRHALTRSHFLRVFSVYGPCGAKRVRPIGIHVLSPSTPARVLTYTEQIEEFSVYKTQWVSLTRTECKICHSEKQVVHLPERILCSCAVVTIPKNVVSLFCMYVIFCVACLGRVFVMWGVIL